MSDQSLQRIDGGELAPVPASETILSVIASAARDPKVDVDKMERLLAMQERVLAREAEMQFWAAMRTVQSKIPRMKRDAKNAQTNSTYARFETITRIAVPIYTEHGFSVSYGTADCPLAGHFRVTARVSHTSGHVENYQVDVPSDHLGPKGLPNKTLTHGFGSALKYGQRYLARLIFNIAESDTDDDDGNKAGAQDDQADKLTLGRELWKLLKAQCPTKESVQQWCWDECCLDLDRKLAELDAASLKEVVNAVKKKVTV